MSASNNYEYTPSPSKDDCILPTLENGVTPVTYAYADTDADATTISANANENDAFEVDANSVAKAADANDADTNNNNNDADSNSNTSSTATPAADADSNAEINATTVSSVARIVHGIRVLLLFCAFCLAILPSVLKIYETSHWFREYGEPSVYDNTKDSFKNPNLLFQKQIDNPKVMMRIYFFILPYLAMAACLVMAHTIPKYVDYTESVTNPYHQALTPRETLNGRVLLRTIPFPTFLVRFGAPESVSLGEIIGVVVFLVLNLGTVGVRVRRSLPRGTRKNLYLADDGDAGKEAIPAVSWPAVEVWGKTLGVIAIVNLGWYLLMPIGRRSVLLESLGLSWDRAIKYHRWVGFYTSAIMLFHGLCYLAVLVHGNGHPRYDPEKLMLKHNLLAWGCATGTSEHERKDGYEHENDHHECDEDQRLLLRINIFGIVSLVLTMAITVFALPYFRRLHFEWFYYVHHLFVLVLFFVCLHYDGAIIYLIPGVAIYTIDKLMGLVAYKNCALAKTEMVSSDVLEVSFKIDDTIRYKAGQYVFVNVPSVSHLQWHPYSLTSTPNANPGELFFHIKEAGESTRSWTRRVVEAGRAGQLEMRIDAFYGDYSEELQTKKAVALIGGGIGITPMMSLGMDLIATDPDLPVTILWVCRTVQEFEIFSTTLYNAKNRCPNLTVKVWITLSLPEPKISRESVDELSTNKEKCDLVVSILKPPPIDKNQQQQQQQSGGRIESTDERDDTNNFLFDTTPPGLEPLGNATAMLVAMTFALAGYTSAVNFSWDRDIENETTWTLINVGFVTGMILLSFVVTLLARPLWRSDEKGNASANVNVNVNEIGGTSAAAAAAVSKNQPTDLSITSEEESYLSVGCGGNANANANAGFRNCFPSCNDVYGAMLEGRIGCRPDIESEFQQLAAAHQRDMQISFDTVGVLACGPKAMTNAISLAVHNSGPLSTFFDAGRIVNKDGSDATFAFVEEDWEW